MTQAEAAREYERLLRLIHVLSDDKLDGPEHEALCDEMDWPWYRMSKADQGRMRQLSADLNQERYGAIGGPDGQ